MRFTIMHPHITSIPPYPPLNLPAQTYTLYGIYSHTHSFKWESVDKSMLIKNRYMWFPIILILQAISFCVPNGFWLYFGRQVDCNYIIGLCDKASIENKNRNAITKIVKRIE